MLKNKLLSAMGGAPANYIEDVFSTYLYTGNGSTQTINNGIDLAGEGGLTWIKWRSGGGLGSSDNALFDTQRGVENILFSNSALAQNPYGVATGSLTAFNSNGFSLGSSALYGRVNTSSALYASWTFRKQPKFFDVVTWTGNGIQPRTISHSLGSVPGCVIGKRTSSTSDWVVYHRSLNGGTNPDQYQVLLNTTAAQSGPGSFLLAAAPTSTEISVAGAFNSIGVTYVAYLFAHNAGGFGLSGTDNVISCGSFTTDGNGDATVNLGYEPQWLLVKASSTTSDWYLLDTMRGMSNANPAENARLYANTSGAEASTGGTSGIVPTATGFNHLQYIAANATFIYIAIRRGPMKVPESGTSVFTPVAYTGNGSTQIATTGFPVDTMIEFERTNSSGVPAAGGKYMTDRLRGSSAYLETSSAGAEGTGFVFGLANNTGVNLSSYFNSSSRTYIIEAFRRAPGFFDEVCYTGTGSLPGVAHNLGVTPELKIIKRRNFATDWVVGGSIIGEDGYVFLNTTAAFTSSSNYWDGGNDSATVFSVRNTNSMSDASGGTYVAYLFASAPGVSKVGSYTGTGATQQINCGFTAGARFVMIKRTDSTGDWYVWDSARGIVAGNDPYLLLNSTAAEVTSTDYIDTYSAGFEISSTAPAEINASGGTFIFLAIA